MRRLTVFKLKRKADETQNNNSIQYHKITEPYDKWLFWPFKLWYKDRYTIKYKYSRVSFYDGVTFSNIWLQIESS